MYTGRKCIGSTETVAVSTDGDARKVDSLVLLSETNEEEEGSAKRPRSTCRIMLIAMAIFMFLLGVICILFSVAYVFQTFHAMKANDRVAALFAHSKATNKQSAFAIKRMRELFREYALANHYGRDLFLAAKIRNSKIRNSKRMTPRMTTPSN